MGQVMGVTAAGIEASGLVAGMQAAAATGGSVALVMWPLWAPLLAIGVLASSAAAAAATVSAMARSASNAWREACGNPTGLLKGHEWVMMAHNWGAHELFSFTSEEAALEFMRRGEKIRRILLRLTPGTKSQFSHTRECEWHEAKHRGDNPAVDDELRRGLKATLDAAPAGER